MFDDILNDMQERLFGFTNRGPPLLATNHHSVGDYFGLFPPMLNQGFVGLVGIDTDDLFADLLTEGLDGCRLYPRNKTMNWS